METTNNNAIANKQRHGCVTAWLILMIISNSVTALLYFFATDFVTKNLPVQIPNTMVIVLGVIGIANVIFSVLLLKWNKIGFWGFVLTSIAALVININIGMGIGTSLFGLVGIAILYAVLQIKKEDVTTWENLQ